MFVSETGLSRKNEWNEGYKYHQHSVLYKILFSWICIIQVTLYKTVTLTLLFCLFTGSTYSVSKNKTIKIFRTAWAKVD